VVVVVSDPSSPRSSRRLSDLTAAHPADRTLENLLRTLTAKLDLCARLPVFEYEADAEGHHASAEAFERLAMAERHAFDELLRNLRDHLDEMPAIRAEQTRGVRKEQSQ
jgi:rubrerythrin